MSPSFLIDSPPLTYGYGVARGLTVTAAGLAVACPAVALIGYGWRDAAGCGVLAVAAAAGAWWDQRTVRRFRQAKREHLRRQTLGPFRTLEDAVSNYSELYRSNAGTGQFGATVNPAPDHLRAL